MALRDLMQNYYFGKPDKRDYTEADLPGNRIELFWRAFGACRGNMVGLNLLYLLAWLPAIVWTLLNFIRLSELLAGSAPEARLGQILFPWLLILFPLIAITGPFNAGISLVTHRWAQDEHSFPFGDFKDGVKQNWRQGLLFGLLDGAVPLLTYLCANFYLNLASGSALFLLPLAIAMVAALLWFLSVPLMPALIVSYRLKLRDVVRNAILMAFAQLPRTAGIRLLTLALPIAGALSVWFFPGALSWIAAASSMLYAVILLAFNKFIWASYANFLNEKYLNSKIPGAPVDIGLRPKDKR